MSGHPVKRRRVFYIPGFDPRGAGYYHALYKDNAARQSAVSGLALNVGPRSRAGDCAHRWNITADNTQTTYDTLLWDDIVRREWRSGARGRLRDIVDFYNWPHVHDLGPAIARRSIKRFIGGFYPLIYLTLAALASALVFFIIAGIGSWPWMAIGAVSAAVMWFGAIKLGEKIAVFWLLKIYGFTARWGKGCAPSLDARITAFTDHIAREIEADDAQEVMLVGHSIGGILAIPIAAQLSQRGLKNPLTLVTLGQSIPLVSFQREAQSYRNDLTRVMNDSDILWIDYAAPADGACFPLMEVMPDGTSTSPVRLNTRFVQLYEVAKYKRMRINPYKIHFLYLSASDYAGAYDYFAMTAGPQSLRDRLTAQGVLTP